MGGKGVSTQCAEPCWGRSVGDCPHLTGPSPLKLVQAGRSSRAGLLQAGCCPMAPRLMHAAAASVRTLRAAVSGHDPLLEASLLLLLLVVAPQVAPLEPALRCWCAGLAWLLHTARDRDLQQCTDFCSMRRSGGGASWKGRQV